jgi:type IV pilus assembly protein PilP
MGMRSRHVCNIVILILLVSCLLWSCGDQTEKSKPPVISKKISVPKKTEAAKPAVKKQNAPPVVDKSATTAATDQKTSGATRIYNPENRLNPFTPLFKSEKQQMVAEKTGTTSKTKKRIPQTPLEKISLDQLKLVAIVRAPSGNRALVQDSSGKGYIVKKGTYIGLNSGIVTKINAESVIVEEEKENLMGEPVLQNTEMKLQKPAGE